FTPIITPPFYNHYTTQNKNPVKQGHEINILFYRVLFTGSILLDAYPFLLLPYSLRQRKKAID
ncbi:hypothetical protein, partial [Catenibacterium sp.]|uniref:hypothetical protein n=1 Tax=Catenibacterium sp. TaxID=2049022 RepID=UPI002E75FD3C